MKNTPSQTKNHSFSIYDYKKIESESPKAMKEALKDAPVIAAIRAGSLTFRNYGGGIIESTNCTSKYKIHNKPDHAVLVIGWGETIYG